MIKFILQQQKWQSSILSLINMQAGANVKGTLFNAPIRDTKSFEKWMELHWQ